MVKGSVPLEEEAIWDALKEIPDPEIPVINIIELGIVRKVFRGSDATIITITPTYSGCPAMKAIETDIRAKLAGMGLTNVRIDSILSPAWTTDWMTEGAKKKLNDYGIAPPEKYTGHPAGAPRSCPNCGSGNTCLKSEFGSTACKALYVCKNCLEPFDYFKCH